MGAVRYCSFSTILYYLFGEFSALMTDLSANAFSIINVLVFSIITWRIAKFSRMAPIVGLLIFLTERALIAEGDGRRGRWSTRYLPNEK